MGDFLQLPVNRRVDLGMVMAVEIGPDRGVGIEVFFPGDIPEHCATARNDHDRLAFQPVAKLGEWMPDARVIEASKFVHRRIGISNLRFEV